MRTRVVCFFFGTALGMLAALSPSTAWPQTTVLYTPGSTGQHTPGTSQAVTQSSPAKTAAAATTIENGKSCTTFTFEGVGNLSPVPDFQGISSPGWLGLIEDDFGGGGNFAYEPSAVTIAFWLGTSPARDILFVNPVSSVDFFYTSAVPISIVAYDANGATVGSISAPANYTNGPPDDDTYTGWSPIKLDVNGNKIVKVTVTGQVNQTGIDDLKVCTAIGIHSIEVTQTIQQWQQLSDLKTSLQMNQEPPVPIIANKPAVLRVYMQKVEAVTDVRVDVSGAINASKQLTLEPQCTPQDRRRLDNGCLSIDFYFTPPVGTWSVALNVFDSNGTLLETENLQFASRKTNSLILKAVSICDSKDSAGNWQCAPANALSSDIGKLSRLAPTSDVLVQVTNSVVREDSATYATIDDWWEAAIHDVNNLYGFFDSVADFFSATHRTYYGTIRPTIPGVTGGQADGIPSRGAGSRTSVIRLGTETVTEVVAHEVGHTLGLKHTNTQIPVAGATPPGCYNLAKDPTTDWPFANNRIQSIAGLEVGFDLAARQPIIPDNTFDVMSYCVPRWISPFSYKKAMDNLGVTAPGAAPTSASPQTTFGTFWTVSGSISGNAVVFDPLFQVNVSGMLDSGTGTYRIEVQNANGGVLFTRYFTPQVPQTETSVADVQGKPMFFELVPTAVGAARIIVFDASNTQLGALNFSGVAPTVTITSPTPGVLWSGIHTISWDIVDPDSTTFTTKVLYSANGGTSWSQLGEVRSGSLLVDFDMIPGAINSALITVVVSDGINTGMATSGQFSVTKKQNITAQILSPVPNTTFKEGDLVLMQVAAYDVDDGVLTGSSIRWDSNIDGFLGNGASLAVTKLQPGTHQITMTASDSDNNNSIQTVPIRVAGSPPTMNLTVNPLNNIIPTTCMLVTISPAIGVGGVELAKIEYSLNGGNTWAGVPLNFIPLTFIVPGSGFFHVVARTFDAAGQLASRDAEFFTAGPCQSTQMPTTTTVSPATGQYSDVVALQAMISPAGVSGAVQFLANGSPIPGTATYNSTTGVATQPYTIPLGQGSYSIQTNFTSSNPSFSNSTGNNTLTVTREDAVLTPDPNNALALQVATPGGMSGPFALSANIVEVNDGSPGDVSKATPVTCRVTPVGPGSSISTMASTTGGGVGGILTARCNFNNVPVNVYDVAFSIGGNFYTGSAHSVLTIFDPSLGFVTGGGEIINPNTGFPANFGFNTKFLKNANSQGSLLYLEHRPTGDVVLKSNALGPLAIVNNQGIVTGKATLSGVGNYTFLMNAIDNGEPGIGDQFGLKVNQPNNAVVSDLTFKPVTLSGGNIQVPH